MNRNAADMDPVTIRACANDACHGSRQGESAQLTYDGVVINLIIGRGGRHATHPDRIDLVSRSVSAALASRKTPRCVEFAGNTAGRVMMLHASFRL